MSLNTKYDILDNRLVIRRLNAGDRQCFEACYRFYYKGLCSFASRWVSLPVAEDIVQDTMLYIWENRDRLMEELSLKGLLFMIVRNKSLDRISSQKVHSRVHQQLEKRFADQFDSPDFYLGTELARLYREALAQLPEQTRRIFEMSRFQGMTHQQIAAEMEDRGGADRVMIAGTHGCRPEWEGRTVAELAEELKAPKRLPEAVARVVRAYADPEGEDAETVDTSRRFEKELFGAYYAACGKAGSRFLREWSAFDRNLRNVSAAVTARAAGRAVEEVVVGGGDVAEQLQRSSAADFGLRGELPYIDAVIAAVNDEANLVEKEHKIDLIRWNEAAELATFDYFDVNAILSYLVRINIVARWTLLDAARGREMFARLLAELDGKELINKE